MKLSGLLLIPSQQSIFLATKMGKIVDHARRNLLILHPTYKHGNFTTLVGPTLNEFKTIPDIDDPPLVLISIDHSNDSSGF